MKIARRTLAQHIAEQLRAGAKTQDIANKVAAYLVDHQQTRDVDLLLRDVEEILENEFGIITARVTSARALDDATRKNITATLLAQSDATEVIIVDETVDADLIGGVVVETATGVFDSSLKSKLRDLAALRKG
jgi:F-type H+-transporting ATPase subunit delta